MAILSQGILGSVRGKTGPVVTISGIFKTLPKALATAKKIKYRHVQEKSSGRR